jgi:hypothetical protein
MNHYFCECCSFSTKIKTHYERHIKTKKHLMIIESSNENGSVNDSIESNDKDLVIEELQKEIMYLRGKIEAYELVLNKINLVAKPVTEPVAKPVVEPVAKPVVEPVDDQEADDKIINCEVPLREIQTQFELNEDDELFKESIAMMREEDDQTGFEINADNVYDCFFHNSKNNLPYLSEFLNIIDGDTMVISNLLLEHFKPTIKVTEVYKKRFFLYSNGNKLSVDESDTILQKAFESIYSHLRSYIDFMKTYYCWDTKSKSFNHDKVSDIKPIIRELKKKISDCGEWDYEQLPYILKALNEN